MDVGDRFEPVDDCFRLVGVTPVSKGQLARRVGIVHKTGSMLAGLHKLLMSVAVAEHPVLRGPRVVQRRVAVDVAASPLDPSMLVFLNFVDVVGQKTGGRDVLVPVTSSPALLF